MQDRLFFLGALGFAAGIVYASLSSVSLSLAGFVLFLGVLLLGIYAVAKRRAYAYIGVVLIVVALGIARVWSMPREAPAEFTSQIGTEITFEGIVSADPDIRETTQRITVDTGAAKILAVALLYPEISYGEKVRVTGMLERPQPFDTDGGRVFRYDQFLAKDGVFLLAERASIEVLEERQGAWHILRGALSDAKRAFLASLARALPEPHAALAGGLVAGGKQGLGANLLDAFIVSGLVHIVVLSGYNVMIVAEAVMRLLSVFPRRIAASGAAFTIGAFVLAAGAGAASIRAGLMAGIALFARATYRMYDALRALVFVGVLMLLSNPLLLMYDPGFELSFLATVGLILGAPLVERKLLFLSNDFFRDIMASTIAAQIAVLPLLLYQNGLFSLVALPANLLVLPLVPLAMAASACAGFVGFIAPGIAPLLGLPAHALLSYIIGVVEISAGLPLASFSVPAFPFALVLLAYAGLGYYLWTHRALIGVPRASAHLLRSS